MIYMTNEEIKSCIQTLRFLENTFLDDHGIFLNDKHPDNIEKIITFLKEESWIPVKYHLATDPEEIAELLEGQVFVIDSPMPEEDQKILVTVRGRRGDTWVDMDIACKDSDGWYTDGGYDWIDDIIAWKPFLVSYKESEQNE